jgi:o-succinylbenzoate synthase
VRLASVEVIPYALPFKQPYVTARGTLTQREMVLLRLTSDEGAVGLGEAVPLSLRGGVTIERVVRELEELAVNDVFPDFIEHGSEDAGSMAEIDPRLSFSAPSRCAVMTAIYDLYETAADHVGGTREPVTCNATLVAGNPGDVANDALDWAGDGFSTFKLKLGAGDDVAQIRAVREALGDEAKIRVDANGSWSAAAAAERVRDLEPFGIELIEQPVASTEEAARLSRLTSIPLSGDESIVTLEDARRAVEINAFQVTGIKMSKVGGYFEAMPISEMIPAYASSALDGPVGIAAAASLAAELDESHLRNHRPALAHGLATQRLFAATIAAVECRLQDGTLQRPAGPGLGVVIDEDALDAHRL